METKEGMETKDELSIEIEGFTTIVNKSLSRILDISEFKFDDDNFLWEPPEEPGLSNSDYIIPAYYNPLPKKHNNILDINYYEIIKDDIRNYRKLNKYQMDYIKGLDDECKNELFDVFNDCLNALQDIV
jgi:hypothetical protein